MRGGCGRVPLAVFLALLSSGCATSGGSARLENGPGGNEDLPGGNEVSGGNQVSAANSSVEREDRADRFDSRIATLLVENSSGFPIAVRLNGFRVGTATSGRSCIELSQRVGEILLEFVPFASSPQVAWPIHLGESLHWRVSVGPGKRLKYDLGSLRPAQRSCRR